MPLADTRTTPQNTQGESARSWIRMKSVSFLTRPFGPGSAPCRIQHLNLYYVSDKYTGACKIRWSAFSEPLYNVLFVNIADALRCLCQPASRWSNPGGSCALNSN